MGGSYPWQRFRVVVTIDYQDLLAGVGTGTLDTGERVSAATVRKLASSLCDWSPGGVGRAGTAARAA